MTKHMPLPLIALAALALVLGCSSSNSGTDTTGGNVDTSGPIDFGDAGSGGRDSVAPPLDSVVLPGDTADPQDVPPESCPMVGDRRCGAGESVEECREGIWVTIQVCPLGQVCALGRCVPRPTCEPGEIMGCASETQLNVCGETGQEYLPVDCPEGQFCVQGQCGDQLCFPSDRKCLDLDTVLYCNAEGDGWDNPTPCGEGSVCRDGACVSGCEAAIKLSSYIGCEYWTVDLDNYPDPFTNPMPFEVPHSVVISNPGLVEAVIQFESQFPVPIVVPNPVVPPQQARAFVMPRHDIDGTEKSFKSIRITSSMPVNAYQFNPLNNESVYSNDGSLLLPANTLGRKYIVASWPSGVDMTDMIGAPAQSGYFTIVATTLGVTTTVSVTASANTTASADGSIAAMTAGETRLFELQPFEILSLQAAPAQIMSLTSHDLTGSLVESNYPVAVFGGHEEAVVTYTNSEEYDSCCADHLEEQLIPVQVWRNSVICAKAPPRSASGEMDVWRIFSADDGNQISTVPPIAGLNGLTLDYGEWVEIKTELSFEVHGTGKVMAAQYTVSAQQTDRGVGDPSMILSVPEAQYRSEYRILVPDGYQENFVTVIRPQGLQITVDGVPAAVPFTSIGGGQWEVGYVKLIAGVHEILGALPFGLIAFGWDNAVSYGYPAGLNLRAEDWTPGK